MPYVPHTDDDVRRALEAIGVDDVEALFADVPEPLRDPPIDLSAPLDETALLRRVDELAARDRTTGPDFLGGGLRSHFIPAVTPHLAFQSEFVTAYTPYQPEVAQGVLQATFEYQSMMCELTGLAGVERVDVRRRLGRRRGGAAGGSADEARDGARLARRAPRDDRGVADLPVAARHRARGDRARGPHDAGADRVERRRLRHRAEPELRRHARADARARRGRARRGALFVAAVDPLSLAVLASPGEVGADIAVGDGQTLGNPVGFGGPSFGFMVVTEPLLRQLPGRLVGQTTDVDGKRAFVLTLQAREQHIRRSKAKSNICSNHQLTALMATINMAALGPQGLREMAEGSVRRAHQLADALRAAGGDVRTGARFFNEFVLRVDRDPVALRRALAERGIRAGVPVPDTFGLGHAVTLATTERTSEDDIAALVSGAARAGRAGTGPREVTA
jgi:glycine dehydrogenase subunit 1